MDLLEKQRSRQASTAMAEQNNNYKVEQNLYQIEAKLIQGRERAIKRQQDQLIRVKSQNRKVAAMHDQGNAHSLAHQHEAKELENLNKIYQKSIKIKEVNKERERFLGDYKGGLNDKMEGVQRRRERLAMESKQKQNLLKRQNIQKTKQGELRKKTIQAEVDMQIQYRKEAARLKQEEVDEIRQEQKMSKEISKQRILEKHLGLQRNLEAKKQVEMLLAKRAAEQAMQRQIARVEGKKERERMLIQAEKEAERKAKMPKKPKADDD